MAYLTLLIFIFFYSPAQGFQYSVETNTILQPSLLRAQQLSQHFERNGFFSIRGESFIHANKPYDFVYVNQYWNKAFLIKEGLQAPNEILNTINKDKNLDVHLFHFELEKSSYVLLALGFSTEELITILSPLKSKNAVSKWSLLLPSAQAGEGSCQMSSPSAISIIKNSGTQLEEGMVLRTIGKCASDAMEGVKKSGENTLDFFKKLATNPNQLWKEMKNSFLELKEITFNLKNEIENILTQLGKLPSEQYRQLICLITGKTVGAALQLTLTAGSAIKLLPSIINQLRTLAVYLSKIAQMERLGIKVPNFNWITNKVLSCAR